MLFALMLPRGLKPGIEWVGGHGPPYKWVDPQERIWLFRLRHLSAPRTQEAFCDSPRR